MKKAFLAAFAALFLAAGGVHAIGLGVPFGFGGNTTFGAQGAWDWGSDIGVRLHFTDMVALQPSLSFCTRDEGSTNIGLNVDLLFYLFESNGIRQYLGGSVGLNIADDSDLRLGGIYGLQHGVTSAVDIFGQVGLGLRFEPGRFYTVNTQLGVIFYIMR
jgi:hypothetical protein